MPGSPPRYFGTDVLMVANASFATSGLKTEKTSSVIGILIVESALSISVKRRLTTVYQCGE